MSVALHKAGIWPGCHYIWERKEKQFYNISTVLQQKAYHTHYMHVHHTFPSISKTTSYLASDKYQAGENNCR